MNVFISYSFKDRPLVNQLVRALKKQGIEPIIVNLKVLLGGNLIDGLRDVLRTCERVIPVISSSYMRDRWLSNNELNEILDWETDRQKTDRDINFVLPIQCGVCKPPDEIRDRVVDFTGVSFPAAFRELAPRLVKTPRVFVIMKFKDLDVAYKLAMKPAIQECGCDPKRADEINKPGMITEQVQDHIMRSDVIVADLSGARPNCYYEVGFAHALRKKLILTIRESDYPPHFDLTPFRFLIWKDEVDLREKLTASLRDLLGAPQHERVFHRALEPLAAAAAKPTARRAGTPKTSGRPARRRHAA